MSLSFVPALDIVRCLRNRKAFSFITKTKTGLPGDDKLSVLVPAINRAWSMAPDTLTYLRNDHITPYLPSETSDETSDAIKNLIESTTEFYESDKALRISYVLVATRKLSSSIEQTFKETQTPFEMDQGLKTSFAELAQLDVLMRRYSENEIDDDNRLILSPGINALSLMPPGGASRVCATIGGDLDVALGGGLEEGTYTILLGSKGEGKTWITSAVAAANALRGKNVLVFTLENSKYSIGERAVPLFLQFPFFCSSFRTFRNAMLKSKPDAVTLPFLETLVDVSVSVGNPILSNWKDVFLESAKNLKYPLTVIEAMNELAVPFYTAMNELIKVRQSSMLGTIDVRFYPSNSLKISDIEQVLETSELKYGLIMVDYLNAVAVPPGAAKHEYFGWFANEVRRLASCSKCASWINAQLKRGFKMFSKAQNKGGLDEEVFYEFIAEAFSAVWGADYVLVLMANQFVHAQQKGEAQSFRKYERALLLNRAREVPCGDWFSTNIDFDSGHWTVKKVSV